MGKLPQRKNFTEWGMLLQLKIEQDMIEACERSMITSIWKHSLRQWDIRNDESHKDEMRVVAEYKQHTLDEKIKGADQDKANLMYPLDPLQEQQFNITIDELFMM
jgi:hypothetical protein